MKKSELIQNLKKMSKDYSVLYVEDNEKLRLQATIFLKKFFEKLYVAEDGKEGLQAFKEHKPDIIITDIKMPKMDGIKMIHEIRKLSKDVIIIISSGHDDKDYLFSDINEGIFRYLKKPLEIYSLTEILLEAIQSKIEKS